MMRAAVLSAPGEMRIARVPVPAPGPGEVRIRLEGCGVCASNLEPWAGLEWLTYPGEAGGLGHEGWGVVDAVGADVAGLGVGDRVAALSFRSFADYDVAKAEAVVKLPAALAGQPFPGEPLGCAFNIFRRSDIAAGQTVAIIGIGFLGAILTKLASDAGARVIAISRRQTSLDSRHGLWRGRGDRDGRSLGHHRASEADHRRAAVRAGDRGGRQAMAARSGGRTGGLRRQAGRRRLSSGWAAPGEHANLELEGHRRGERARARSGGVPARAARSCGGGRLGPARSGAALYPSSFRSTRRRGARCDARQAGRFREGAGDLWLRRQEAPRLASSASAGSAATEWRPCSRPVRSRRSRSAIPPRKWRQQAAKLAPGAAVVEFAGGHARARARRRGDRLPERAARRAIDPGAGGGGRGVLPEAARAKRRRGAGGGRGGAGGRSPARGRSLLSLYRGDAVASPSWSAAGRSGTSTRSISCSTTPMGRTSRGSTIARFRAVAA